MISTFAAIGTLSLLVQAATKADPVASSSDSPATDPVPISSGSPKTNPVQASSASPTAAPVPTSSAATKADQVASSSDSPAADPVPISSASSKTDPVASAAPKSRAEHLHTLTLEGQLNLRGLRTRSEPRRGELGEPRVAHELGVSRAQIELGYRYRKWLAVVLQGDLAAFPGAQPEYAWPADDTPEPAGDGFPLEDAYARIGGKELAVRIGYFKPPVSAVEMDSSWDLPIARRGILHAALVEDMRFAGRRPGIQLEWAAGSGSFSARSDPILKPKLRVGVFQGSDSDGSPLHTLGVYETNLAARGSIQQGPVEVGLFGTLVGTPPYTGALVGRYWLVGADALADATMGPLGVRAWVDLAYGLSFHGLYGALGQDAPFAAGRALLAVRRGGDKRGSSYLELFGMAEAVNFDLTAEHRTLSGYVAGLNVGFWDRLRLTFQAEVRKVGIYSPNLSAGGNQLRERTVFLAQLGGAYDARWRF
jgi:hypothetical protein